MKEITVQIKVQEYGLNHYILKGKTQELIHKSDCTVIADPVDSIQPEVKGWRIRVTYKNIIPLRKWVEHKDGSEVLGLNDWVLSRPSEDMCFPCHETNPNGTFNKGFTEVATVEEFFEKVGYTASPKLIAKAGEKVKIINMGEYKGNLYALNKPYELSCDFYENGDFMTSKTYAMGLTANVAKTMKFEVCPAPVQRKSIGVYEGVEIFDDTKSWYIDLDDLEVYECLGSQYGIEDMISEGAGYTKNYLDPKEANARLKKEVEKKAKEKTFTTEEVQQWQDDEGVPSTFTRYAIQQVEKEFGVTYLTE